MYVLYPSDSCWHRFLFFQKDVAKITDEVYMEVVVGGEDPGSAQRTLDNSSLSKDFMPVAWAAAYG